MDGETLQRTAADYAEELPGAGLEHPFGPEWEVYKVHGKVVMLMTQVTGEPLVILKSAPDEAAALRHEHMEITPGYHMSKKHWITLEGGDTIDETLAGSPSPSSLSTQTPTAAASDLRCGGGPGAGSR